MISDEPMDARSAELRGLEATFLANRSTLARFLAARRGSFGDAEDILQELWIKVRTQDVRPLADPLSYLFRMAENLIRDRARSATAQRLRETEWTKERVDISRGESVDTRPSHEEVLIARDHLRRVEAALDALPDPVAAAFRAVRFEGKPQRQVAAELGLSLSSIEKYLVTAFKAVLAEHPNRITVRGDRRRLVEDGDVDARSGSIRRGA